jgi:hypothetical protein
MFLLRTCIVGGILTEAEHDIEQSDEQHGKRVDDVAELSEVERALRKVPSSRQHVRCEGDRI